MRSADVVGDAVVEAGGPLEEVGPGEGGVGGDEEVEAVGGSHGGGFVQRGEDLPFIEQRRFLGWGFVRGVGEVGVDVEFVVGGLRGGGYVGEGVVDGEAVDGAGVVAEDEDVRGAGEERF